MECAGVKGLPDWTLLNYDPCVAKNDTVDDHCFKACKGEVCNCSGYSIFGSHQHVKIFTIHKIYIRAFSRYLYLKFW